MEQRKLLPLNLQFFADGDENDEDKKPDDGAVDDKTPKGDNKTPGVKKVEMTQDELDALITKRLERERKKHADYEEKAKRLAELEKAEEERKKAAMTEAERLKAEKEEAAKKAEEAAEQAKQAQEKANQRIISTEIKSIARALNAYNPADVLALLDKTGIEIDDEGNVQGVEDAVKALKEVKPWMFKRPVGADASSGSNPAKNPPVNELSAKEKELEETKAAAVKNPRLFGKVTQLYNEILALKQGK